MLIKIHKGTRYVVAVCDSDLIGEKFVEGERQLDLTGRFFDGAEKTVEEIKGIVEDMKREDACFNFVGEESVELGKEVGLVGDGGVIVVQGVPISLVLM